MYFRQVFLLRRFRLAEVAMLGSIGIVMVILMYCSVPMEEVEVGASIQLRDVLEPIPRVKEKVFLLFTVLTVAKNFNERAVIRKTWASQQWAILDDVEPHYRTNKVMFVVGRNYVYNLTQEQDYPEEFIEEMRTHDDILMTDLSEERGILKYKVILSMLRGLVEFDFDYFVKTDDDVFVDVPLLVRSLIPLSRTNIYTGNYVYWYGDWAYCSGGGYVLSHDVVRGMMNVNKHVRVMIQPEDAYSGYLVYMLNNHYNWNINSFKPSNNSSIRPNGTRTTQLQALDLTRKCYYGAAWFWHFQDNNWKKRLYRMANGLDPLPNGEDKTDCSNTKF